MTGWRDHPVMSSRICCCPLRRRGTGRACAVCWKMSWRISPTGNCLHLSWALEPGSMLYVLPRRCLLLPGNLQTSHRSVWTGLWPTEQVLRTADLLTAVQQLGPWLKWLCRSQAAFCMFACSIKAYIAATQLKTVLQPVQLDASQPWEQWAGVSQGSCDIIVAINLVQYCSFKTAQVHYIKEKYTYLSMIKYLKTQLNSFYSFYFYSLRVSLLERARSSSKTACC